MPPARTDAPAPSGAAWAGRWDRLHGYGPVVGLVLLCIAGALLNADFASVDNAMNVLTRTAFIGIIAVGMCFVIVSGGNQQKLALAKVLQPRPRVVVLDEPTRGVDVGAKRDIYFLIDRLAASGAAVVVISSELMDLIGLCHRVAVMRAGRLQAVLPGAQLTEEALIAHATGTH